MSKTRTVLWTQLQGGENGDAMRVNGADVAPNDHATRADAIALVNRVAGDQPVVTKLGIAVWRHRNLVVAEADLSTAPDAAFQPRLTVLAHRGGRSSSSIGFESITEFLEQNGLDASAATVTEVVRELHTWPRHTCLKRRDNDG